jgi:hypothetical protein
MAARHHEMTRDETATHGTEMPGNGFDRTSAEMAKQGKEATRTDGYAMEKNRCVTQ